MDKVRDFLKELFSTLGIIMLYSDEHPKSISAMDNLYTKLDKALREYNDITIGIVAGEFVFGKEIFFEFSNRFKYLAKDLTDRGVEKIIFKHGVTKQEMVKFISALVAVKDEQHDFAEYFRNLNLNNIIIGRIGPGSESDEGTALYKGNEEYNYSVDSVSGSFKNIFNGGIVDARRAQGAMKNTLEVLLKGGWGFVMLTSVKRHDLFTFTHSLNVSTLAMAFVSELSFSKENIIDVGTAALFHDTGKIAISQKIIEKPGFLTSEEMSSIKSHTILGAEILLQQVDYLGVLPAVVAFEHHLRYDLKGYPKLKYRKHPHFVSLVVSLCDYYDALSSKRSYKRDYPPRMIYEIMLKERGKMFELSLFDKFFDFMGVYPIGTIVKLDKGWIGIVREQNKGDIFSPKVEIVSFDKNKGMIVDLKENKKVHIENSLNPLSEGKEYISYI